jgi:hypothetical protein
MAKIAYGGTTTFGHINEGIDLRAEHEREKNEYGAS